MQEVFNLNNKQNFNPKSQQSGSIANNLLANKDVVYSYAYIFDIFIKINKVMNSHL